MIHMPHDDYNRRARLGFPCILFLIGHCFLHAITSISSVQAPRWPRRRQLNRLSAGKSMPMSQVNFYLSGQGEPEHSRGECSAEHTIHLCALVEPGAGYRNRTGAFTLEGWRTATIRIPHISILPLLAPLSMGLYGVPCPPCALRRNRTSISGSAIPCSIR